MSGDSKTEKATPKRRQDERKKGNVLVSKDVITIVSLLGCFFSLKLLFPQMINNLKLFMFKYFNYAANKSDISNDFFYDITKDLIAAFIIIGVPLIVISVVLSIVATIAQTKPLFVADSIKPKFSRINPLQGIKRLCIKKFF